MRLSYMGSGKSILKRKGTPNADKRRKSSRNIHRIKLDIDTQRANLLAEKRLAKAMGLER